MTNVAPFPDKKYDIIYADPPWRYQDRKPPAGGAEQYYETMVLTDILNMPISSICSENSILFLWATYPLLPEAIQTVKAWGFNYKCVAFTWVKQNKKGQGFFYGLGRWTRGNPEICLLATKGKPKRVSTSVENLTISPLRKHSQKPDIVRDKIVQLMGDLPRIELFARETAQGWDSWGNEV